MAKALKRISLNDLSDDLVRIFERVISKGEPIVIESSEGEMAALSPMPSTSPKSEEDWEAFRAAAGSWADVDSEAFLKDIYESRKSSRPPVDL